MKLWMRGPGECVDCKGVPIYPGDLLKTFHFTGARRKKHWLYHFATMKDGSMWMINISNFGPTNFILDGGGNCLLSDDLAAGCEVIAGSGPKPYLDFDDRPRQPKEASR